MTEMFTRSIYIITSFYETNDSYFLFNRINSYWGIGLQKQSAGFAPNLSITTLFILSN